MKRHAPVLAAFVSGIAVMSLELLGSRIVAPYLGSSILIWTNLIGVILVALALGAWFGGVAADRYPDTRLIGALFAFAGVWCFLLGYFAPPVMQLLAHLPYAFAAPVASFFLLAPPAFVLAAVSPAVLRLSVTDVERAGHVAGLVSATGTVGSLVGTYVTGYFLLPRASIATLLYSLGALLLISAILSIGKRVRSGLGAAIGSSLLIVPFTVSPSAISSNDIPSAYGYVAVLEANYHGAPARMLRINTGIHAAAPIDEPQKSILTYVKALRSIDLLVATPTRMLTLGGGGFHVAGEFLARHPDADVDVVEIDPAVLKAAEEAFGVSTSSHLTIFLEDARSAIRHLRPEYDVVIADAYSGDVSVPWHLLTAEAVKDYHDLLAPNGLFAANMIFSASATSPEAKSFVARSVGTLRSSFDWVRAVTLNNGTSPTDPANTLVLAGNGLAPDMNKIVKFVQREVGEEGIAEVALPEPGEPWTDGFGTADYQSLAMYREAWDRLSGW